MKKLKLFLLAVFYMSAIQAQDYMISFTGTGENSTVEKVLIENLTQGKNLSILGSDVLHLVSTSTGFDPVLVAENGLNIYPNPMTDKSIIDFVTTSKGIVQIEFFEITGKSIIKVQSLLADGSHSYQVTGLRSGIYFVKINAKSYSITSKLVSNCNCQTNSDVKVWYNGSNLIFPTTNKLKSVNAEQVMQYTKGDRLKITGTSGNYSTVLIDIPIQSKTLSFNFVSCTDADGNNYPVVQIGSQSWMGENLKVTSYNDGSPLTLITDNLEWSTQSKPAYCYYNNDPITFKDLYGPLYNWYAVNTGMIAPKGWHVPTDEEWTTLTNYLGGLAFAGAKLKETGISHWQSPNGAATNASGFSALPNGYRNFMDGSYDFIGKGAGWWSSTIFGGIGAWHYSLGFMDGEAYRRSPALLTGSSVRCIKDI